MLSFYSIVLVIGVVYCSNVFAASEPLPINGSPETFLRVRRFTDRNQYNGPNLPQEKKPQWEVKPDLSRDQRGNTRGQITIQKHGENHDVEAGWGQNIRGPDKHSGTFHVGGSVRW